MNASQHIEDGPKDDTPTVVILDNNTPHSGQTGYFLAMRLLQQKEKYPNFIVVTVSSSDLGLVTRDGGKYIDALKASNGEFWAKSTERNLMALWIAVCLKEGRMIPREEWLTELGIDTRYRDQTVDERVPEETALFYLVGNLDEKYNDPVKVLQAKGLERGDAFKLGPAAMLTKLGFPKMPIEGNQTPTLER